MGLVDKLFGNKSEKEIKRIEKYVDAIEALDEKMQALSDEELRAKTQEFKDRLAAGETLDDLLVEAFAVVREAAETGRRKEAERPLIWHGLYDYAWFRLWWLCSDLSRWKNPQG